MKKLTQKEINKILEEHKHWLNEDCDGWENMRAVFSECNLSSADLSSADLRYADLRYADLRYADLRSANLRYADLRYADLSSANLSYANLRSANLSSADLSYANLSSADLRYADLRYANLSYANLRYADLSSADLSSADLSSADLSYAKEIPYIPMICPEEDDFIGWKKAQNKIIKLHIPANARRTSATTRKCRCDIAEVIEIYNLDGTIAKERQITSDRDSNFIYEVGKAVVVKDFDDNRWEECTKGIHFFMNRQEAINYN